MRWIKSHFYGREYSDKIVLGLFPGKAFAQGTHQSTHLMIETLDEIFKSRFPSSILDIGAGSGILSILGALSGANRVVAIELDEASATEGKKNALLNGVEKTVEVHNADFRDLHNSLGRFDLVLANITANLAINFSTLFANTLSSRGKLILSGFMVKNEKEVLKSFRKQGIELEFKRHNEDWTTLVLRL